jgi:conjugal transfer pilus assembly protein TraU
MSKLSLLLVLFLGLTTPTHSKSNTTSCSGHFINPITDICWGCLFPLTIGSFTVVNGKNPDTQNPASPIQVCREGALPRVGLAIGYWEPFAITDVTRSPYCLVNLGGISLPIEYGAVRGGTEDSDTTSAFYQVHWYKYPLILWLNILTSAGCFQHGDYDIGYVSELDPMWHDDELSFISNPEAILFANPVAQSSCALDAVSSTTHLPDNSLFWCMGAQGSCYPLSGNISQEYSPLENSTLLTERMAFKLHRELLLNDSSGEDVKVCHEHLQEILPKNRYRYELVNPTADSNSCHPFGSTSTSWQLGKLNPAEKGNYGYLVWRKRNCVFL